MSFLQEFKGHPGYRKLLDDIEKIKPVLPKWQIDPISGKDNTEEWKHASAMLEGFENCLQILFPK